MRIVSARTLVFGFAAVMAWSAASEAATLALKATKKNGAAIPGGPVSFLTVAPNDTIEADLLLSGWGTGPDALVGGLRTYQAKLDGTGFVGGTNGNVFPLGWKAPTAAIACNPPACPAGPYPNCMPPWGCVAAGHNPALGADIDALRPDFVFFDQSVTLDEATSNLNYRYFALREDGGTSDPGIAKYVGTLKMQVSLNACGAFSIGFITKSPLDTFIANPDAEPTPVVPTTQSLVLTVDPCNAQMVDCFPATDPNAAHCDIDARIPHSPTNAGTSGRLTTDRLMLRYDRDMAGQVVADYELSLVGTGGPVPAGISSVNVAGTDVTIILNGRIRPQNWTCLRDKESDQKCCMGSLPADTDWSQVSQPADTFYLLENLLGITSPPLLMQQCDIDRSLLCNSADLLMNVDLLVGADSFQETNGDVLPVCPSFRAQ